MDIAYLCGGEGTRLRPLTYAVPKPMLPIGPKPILELNIIKAKEYGFKRFFLMVNYKAEIIRNYFGNGNDFGVAIQYFEELEARGTAGPILFLKDIIKDPIVVMNADILTDVNLKTLLLEHKKKKADLTVALKRIEINIPYGIAKLTENDSIQSLEEKPTYEFLINSGIYIVSPCMIDFIPETGIYHMPQLIDDGIKNEKNIIGHVFDESWRDIGRLDDYIKAFNETAESNQPFNGFNSHL